MRSAWSASEALQVTSTTRLSLRDSTTSSAVSAPPAAATAAAMTPVVSIAAGASARTVMEYPGLGADMSGFPSLLFRIMEVYF